MGSCYHLSVWLCDFGCSFIMILNNLYLEPNQLKYKYDRATNVRFKIYLTF